MGYVLSRGDFDEVLGKLGTSYRLWAPVLKRGEGRFTDTDVIRYDFVHSLDEIELAERSDYAAKEILLPMSQTLFFFTEGQTKEADIDESDVIVFCRSCDMHAIRRLDGVYLHNGVEDPFYKKVRDHIHFALIGCQSECKDGFCVSMGTNRTTEGYLFSIDAVGDEIRCDVADETLAKLFEEAGARAEEVTPAYVTENTVKVTIPETVPNAIYKNPLWDEYSSRCINCGRCNLVCPTCTCYTMQDTYYTDNGKVGERRRVEASCMINGFTNVAGGGQYRRSNGERMRFKVLHKIYNHRERFGENMCVGCGRCDTVCPEYISYANIINKVNAAVEEGDHE